MSRFRYMLMATVVLLMAMTAIALAGQRHTSPPRGPAPVHSAQAHAHTVAPHHTTARHTASADPEQNTTDSDNVQQGDQTSPDTPSSGASEENTTQEEQSADTEQGQLGEPSSGHQDPPGDVNHECSGSCQE